MKVVVQGQGEVNLTQRDFVAAGGEGQVFARGATAYKVYADASKALPVGKIAELSGIADPNIIKPERVLSDPKTGVPVGYTMRFVSGGLPLCQVFPRAFRDREGLDHPRMLTLVQRLRLAVENVHRAGVLLVDLNEMNFLVDAGLSEVYGIDVDSYQTRSYPATALMPSVRDWSVQGHDFTEMSDWFSFACVSFQMLVGIHPYKGKHPTVHGLEERMRAGVSVFDPAVAVPKVVYPFTVIPPGYLAWFRAVLQEGKRLAPPADPGKAPVAILVTVPTVGTIGLDIAQLATFESDILGYEERGGVVVIGLASGVFVGGRRALGPTKARAVGFTANYNRPVVAWVEGGVLHLFDAVALVPVPCSLVADDVMGCDGRVYIRAGDLVVEVVLTDTSAGVIASSRVAVNVLQHATRMFEGVVLQDLLGSTFASVFPRTGASVQHRIPEIDGYRIVDARCDGRVLMIIGAKAGRYDRLTFVFSADHSTYKARPVVRDVTPAGLNFVALESGVVVHLTEEEKLEVTSVDSDKVRIVEDKVLGNDMRIVKHQGRVAFVRGNTLHSLRMK